MSGIRPPWLQSTADVEALLETQDPSFQISLLEMRSSRDNCPIVDEILQILLQQGNVQSPSEWELGIAKSYLAVDVQKILVDWVKEGLRKTIDGSMIGQMVGTEQRRSLVDLRTGSSIPLKRGSPDSVDEDEEDDEQPDLKQMRMNGEKDYRCPYYIRNRHDPAHKECKNKMFPNPRKLKEHIWRFTKPFKCPTCGEGFGREKTREIHCQQRKVKCSANSLIQYEGSYEQERDRGVERARNTTEILRYFDEYDQRKKGLACASANAASGMGYGSGSGAGERRINGGVVGPSADKISASSSSMPVPQSPHDSQQQRSGWVSPDTPTSTNSWNSHQPAPHTQLQVQTYPSTPAHTPPNQQYQQNQLQSPHSPVHQIYPQPQSPMNFAHRQSRQFPQVPQIIINDNMTANPMEEAMSAASATSYHSQPGSPMVPSFSNTGGQMYQDLQSQQHGHQHQQEMVGNQGTSDVQTVHSNGFGSWGPFTFGVKMRGQH